MRAQIRFRHRPTQHRLLQPVRQSYPFQHQNIIPISSLLLSRFFDRLSYGFYQPWNTSLALDQKDETILKWVSHPVWISKNKSTRNAEKEHLLFVYEFSYDRFISRFVNDCVSQASNQFVINLEIFFTRMTKISLVLKIRLTVLRIIPALFLLLDNFPVTLAWYFSHY